MPDRYWVGGSGSWNGTAGTKWAATSGGAGGASVPTTADDVFFDVNSGASTVTIDAGNLGARSINCTGFTGTLGGAAALTVAGGFTFVTAMGFTYGGSFTIAGPGTLTSAGKSFAGGGMIINAPAGIVNLGDALSLGFNFSMQAGTFNTNNFNLTCQSIGTFLTGTRAMNLGSSTVTLSANFFPGDITLNAGTSQINLTNANPTFASNGSTLHNVAFTNTTAGTVTINDNNTFNALSFTAPLSAGVKQVAIAAGTIQTVNGTLSTPGSAGNRRVWFRSATPGISTRLIVNATPSLTDADFRDVIVTGTAAPISGTRIGDLRGNIGITFSAPKSVFRIGTGSWSADQWAATSGGAVSTDNFPLAQDTAVFNNSTTAGTHTMDSTIPYCGTVNMSARTTALTLSLSASQTVYGDWISGSGMTFSGGQALNFSGRNVQTITSAGRGLGNNVTIDSYGGSVNLADALTISSNSVTVINGTFNSGGFSIAADTFQSSNSNVRAINLGASTLTLGGSSNTINFADPTNLTFNAGTSSIVFTSSLSGAPLNGGGLTFNNVTFSVGNNTSPSITGVNTFNNLTVTAPSTATFIPLSLSANQTITGTLTVAGASPIRRIFVRSDTIGTTRTLTVGTLAATDCDFRDIAITGTAAGSSQTRAGDCGGNSGITFPAPKTVFWNLAGTQNWSATGWATSSGGTPAVNNFPLAQDTAVFDNTGAAGTVTIDQTWNMGSFNAGSRTTAMTFSIGSLSPIIYGSWTSGTGLTISSTTGTLTFAGRGTNSITSNGVSFNFGISISCVTGTVQLADAIILGNNRLLGVNSGTFNAVTFNVTTPLFSGSGSSVRSVLMGSGTWTITSTGTVWDMSTTTNLTFNKGTANILLGEVGAFARTFAGGGLAYNTVTIGGPFGGGTLTITGSNTFEELASTITSAHTIALGTTAQTFGRWTVTGSAGNFVSITGTGTSHVIAGAATSGIDYLAMGSIGFASDSPGEFYAGANSTGTAGAPVFRTAPPAPRTLYWVNGTGNWNDINRWSLSSGGPNGQAIPTSRDNVIFDSASNATAYTVTLNVVARCNQLTVAGPASGNLTLAGTNALIMHGNATFPATGFTRSGSAGMVLSGSTTGKTFTSNGFVFTGVILSVNGIGCGWTLGSALNLGTSGRVSMLNGTFSTGNFNMNQAGFDLENGSSKTLNLGSSTITLSDSNNPLNFGNTGTIRNLITLNAGTSQINIATSTSTALNLNSLTYNNITFVDSPLNTPTVTINGSNSFNNLTFAGWGSAGFRIINLAANQTVTGTLTFNAGADATRRSFIRSDTIGTTRTLTVAAFSGTDVDFRDITITGAAAPVSGTRLGDCRGNSGITFPAGVNKFWNLAAGGNWSATAWATTGGGTPAANNFPLAQDTCVFQATGLNSGATVTLNESFNIGTVDMSARTTSTMTFAGSGSNSVIHGNWINGTGVTVTGSQFTFGGRTSQTITSAGISFSQGFNINSPGGTVTLLDALNIASLFNLVTGTFNLNNFNMSAGALQSASGLTRTLSIGSGTLTLTNFGTVVNTQTPTGLTITGNGVISLTSASAKTLFGGGANYGNVAINQGGAGALTINENNTFRDITATQTATSAASILLGTTTQRLTQFTGRGESGRVLTIQGNSVNFPATLVYTGSGTATNTDVNFLTLIGVRAYPLTNTWYAGNNSTNGGTLGWIFEQTPAILPNNGNFFLMFI